MKSRSGVKPATKAARKTAWKPGQSGNPAGRAPGTRNRATLLAQALLDRDVEAIVDGVVKAALAGDLAAAKLVIERVVPPMRERPISIALPREIRTAAQVSEVAGLILQAAGDGDLLPSEAQTLSGILELRRKAVETEELERRVAALESKK